jgi:hypothetical protein
MRIEPAVRFGGGASEADEWCNENFKDEGTIRQKQEVAAVCYTVRDVGVWETTCSRAGEGYEEEK